MSISWITKNRVIIAEAIAILILSLMLFKSCRNNQAGTVLPSVDASVSKHDVVITGSIRALDKKEIAKVADIPSAIVKDGKKEILATGKKIDDSGTSTVAAVLDTTTGQTAIIEKRPFAETMNRSEVGAGYTIGSLGQGYAAGFRHTFGRLTKAYIDVRVDAWKWESGVRKDDDHGADGQVTAFATWRF